jgi:hypothetical protein
MAAARIPLICIENDHDDFVLQQLKSLPSMNQAQGCMV